MKFFEEMVMSIFLKCVKKMIFSASFAKQQPLFSAFFFSPKCSLKIEVCIIHGHALYTGKYGVL